MEATTDEIARRLEGERILILNAAEMGVVSGEMDIARRHDTLDRGDLTEASFRGLLVVVEEPAPGEFVIRRFADRRELELFVERRLEQYERMWDGCGCRIDYYEAH